MSETLFPLGLPERQWVQFRAAGFAGPVCGAVHRGTRPPVCGMPLGGVGTGCLDLEADGTLGYMSIFNSIVPRRGPLRLPFLGLAVGRRVWLLTTLNLQGRPGEEVVEQTVYGGGEHQRRGDVRTAGEIHYWGHYPVVDMEFVTDAPVEVGLRAWSPLLPGSAAESNTPGVVFEVHLRNTSDEGQKGTIALSFPGPNEEEAGTTRLRRRRAGKAWKGVTVSSPRASYALGVIGEEPARVGGGLGSELGLWTYIWQALPESKAGAGATVAVDYELAAGESRVVRFVLAWHAPQWKGGGTPDAQEGQLYTHMYAGRFAEAAAVADHLAANHEDLLRRVLAWQSVIYAEETLPVWLREGLVNNLHLLTEDGLWGQAAPPIGDWCRPADGLWGMIESPNWCPQIECIPCSFYGNLPLVFLFPELALSTLRGYKAYQYPDGQAPWIFGGCTCGTPYLELAMPARGYSHKPQTTLDGPCYAAMVDRLWQRTGSRELLEEFYDSVKRNVVFTMNLRPGSGMAGVVSMPAGNQAQDWFESCDLFGIVPHIGGAHLAQLRMAQRMARAMGDDDFDRQCQAWLDGGSAIMEEHAWAGDCYLLYHELETGKQSGVVMGYQLDGEWMARSHGLAGVFRADRVDKTLDTFVKTAVTADGAITFAPPLGRGAGDEFKPGYWGQGGIHPPGSLMLAMTYLYAGRREEGLELARRTWQALLEQGWSWDLPVLFEAGSRRRQGGFDYYQNGMLWAMAPAVRGEDIAAASKPGGLVARVIEAAGKGRPGKAGPTAPPPPAGGWSS